MIICLLLHYIQELRFEIGQITGCYGIDKFIPRSLPCTTYMFVFPKKNTSSYLQQTFNIANNYF